MATPNLPVYLFDTRAVVVGGLSAIGAAMVHIGIPREQAIRYQTALKVDKYVLLIHGTAAEAVQARAVLSRPDVASRITHA